MANCDKIRPNKLLGTIKLGNGKACVNSEFTKYLSFLYITDNYIIIYPFMLNTQYPY